MSNGYATTGLPVAPLADELIVNRAGSTALQRFADLSTQLAGAGPLADQLDELRALANGEPRQLLPADMATTATIALTGAQTIDGVATGTGKRVLVKDQADAAQNGVWVTSAGAWTRATDLDAAAEFALASIYVTAGTVNRGTTWMQIASVAAVGSSAVTWRKIKDEAGLQAIIDTGLSGKLDRADISADTGLSLVIVDDHGAPTWVEADLAGAPTARVGGLIGPVIDRIGGAALSGDAGLSFVLTAYDGSGRECVTDIELRLDGRFTDRAIRSIADRLTQEDLTAALGGLRASSGPDICCIGDSLTAGAGGTPYPAVLASLSGRTVHNLGVGGETSRTIAGRIGARPWLATVNGGSIPASGGVTVTLAGDDGAVSPLDQGDAGINPCIIAGVIGALSKSGGVYTFTRTTSGSPVPVLYPAPVITAASTARANDILIIEIGQNDGTNDATEIIARIGAIIEWMAPLKKRWLIGGLSTVNAEYRAPYEAQMLRAFGRRFVNIRAWLSSAAAMAYAGLTPTEGDLANIAIGRVPDSLRSDDTHLNTAGYAAKAFFYWQRLTELRFLEN